MCPCVDHVYADLLFHYIRVCLNRQIVNLTVTALLSLLVFCSCVFFLTFGSQIQWLWWVDTVIEPGSPDSSSGPDSSNLSLCFIYFFFTIFSHILHHLFFFLSHFNVSFYSKKCIPSFKTFYLLIFVLLVYFHYFFLLFA